MPGVSEGSTPVEHHVLDGEAPVRSLPTSVSEVGWEWSAEEAGGRLEYILPGVSGPLMVLGSGVVGLDGVTGEELWSYRMPQTSSARAGVTPDHESVLLTLSEGAVDTTVVLDSGTGRVLAEHEDGTGEIFQRTVELTSDAAIVASKEPGSPVETFSLMEGERLWSFEPPERGAGVVVEKVLSFEDTVVLIMAYNDGGLRDDSVDTSEQGMLVIGLDATTGEPRWELEQGFTDTVRRVADHELAPNGRALLLQVGSGNQRHEFLIDPVTGEEIEGEAYRVQERDPVGLLDDGYVETSIDDDESTVDYWYTSFTGEEVAHFEVPERPGEGDDIGRGLLLEEGVLRLDPLTDPDLERGPVGVEFARWEGSETPVHLDADLTVNEEIRAVPEGAVDSPYLPVATLMPGAVVVTEKDPGFWGVVGVV